MKNKKKLSLAEASPDLAAEWNYDKNGDLMPDMVTSCSGRKVWWLQYGENPATGEEVKFEWQARIGNRIKGAGNPYLVKYKGEEFISRYLHDNDIEFSVQKQFPGLVGTGNGLLSYDFCLEEEKILIEYNGLQHYEPVEYFGGDEQFEKQKQHDQLKKSYAKKHGYKLITIKYTYDTYEKVAEYLDKRLPGHLFESAQAA